MKRALAVVALALVTACSTSRKSGLPRYVYAAPPALDDGWTTGTLEQTGIDRGRIEAMTDWIRAHPELNVHAVLIERDGRLVYEEYFFGADERMGRPVAPAAFTRHETAARGLCERRAVRTARHHEISVGRQPGRCSICRIGTAPAAARPREVRFTLPARRDLAGTSDRAQSVDRRLDAPAHRNPGA